MNTSAQEEVNSSRFLFGKIKSFLFGKIKSFLSDIPFYVWVFILVGTIVSAIIGINYLAPGLLQKIGIKKTREENGATNTWEPYKPTPRPLAHGKQTYLVSGSKTGAPKVYEASFDPLDPQPKATQSATVKVISLDGNPVSEVEVNMITDNKQKAYPLKLISGTNLDGSWQGTWTLEDSYDYLYQAAIKAKNTKSDWTVTLTFR